MPRFELSMSSRQVIACLAGLALLSTSVNAWGLGKSQPAAQAEDLQVLPQATPGHGAPLRDHYYWNEKTGTMHVYSMSLTEI